MLREGISCKKMTSTNRCWVCFEEVDNYLLLPYQDEFLSLSGISIYKNTFIVKDVEVLSFLYFISCDNCIEKYLRIYHGKFFRLRERETGYKNRKYYSRGV